VWTLPQGDADFSRRWQKIKARFTHATGLRGVQSPSMAEKREAGLWQRRFWEHMIRDAGEERRAIAFCLSDPVRHGLVAQAEDWPFSTIHRDLRAAVGGPPTLRNVA
nr:transposase [Tabrizicola sp.]